MKRTLAMLAAIMLPFVAMSASYTNSFVRNGVTYVQRGGLTVKDYVVTNVTPSGSSNMTTNDVCNIVTNTISDYANVSNAAMNALSRAEAVAGFTEWALEYTDPEDAFHPTIAAYDGGWALYDDARRVGDKKGDSASVSLEWSDSEWEGNFTVTATRTRLPTMADIPTNTTQLVNGSGYATYTITNGIPEAIASKASTNDVLLAPVYGGNGARFSEWVCNPAEYSGDPLSVIKGEPYDAGEAGLERDWILFGGAVVIMGITLPADQEPVSLNFTGYTIATRTENPLLGYTLGTQTDKTLASTGSVAAAISSADTTYTRFAIPAPTNVNQSVQYVNIADENPSVLSVLLPQGAGTKDWLIYVQSVTNVSINLPAATWWMSDVAFTNDIAPATPTALYFSQIGTGLYLFSRQELSPVTIPAP